MYSLCGANNLVMAVSNFLFTTYTIAIKHDKQKLCLCVQKVVKSQYCAQICTLVLVCVCERERERERAKERV